jgi:hypothetical protein
MSTCYSNCSIVLITNTGETQSVVNFIDCIEAIILLIEGINLNDAAKNILNIGIKSLRDFLFLIAFTLPVTFFSYFILFENLQIKYLSIIFSVLMALTISHMLLPSINRLLLKTFD